MMIKSRNAFACWKCKATNNLTKKFKDGMVVKCKKCREDNVVKPIYRNEPKNTKQTKSKKGSEKASTSSRRNADRAVGEA